MVYTTGNPALKRTQSRVGFFDTSERASYGGIATKSIYFIVLTFVTALASFAGSIYLIASNNFALIIGLLVASVIIAFVASIIAIFNPNATKIAGSIYALAQGFAMGLTALLVTSVGYGGEVFAALFATICTFGVMLFLYSSGIIRVGTGFRKFMISVLISVIVANFLMFIVSLFSATLQNLFYGNGPFSVGISIIMVIVASLMILLDLDRMTKIVQRGLDKKFEWLASFGLLVTLIWLYMEFLRLFLKLASRRR